MSACSSKEELEWRTRLADRSGKELLDSGEHAVLASLSLAIKPMGTVFGKPGEQRLAFLSRHKLTVKGTVARRISIHRAMTVGPTSVLCQVIIKNTHAFKDLGTSATINRSQSLLTTNRIPVLAPPRADRIRLETLLADVWTREILPYPGMTGRARSEHPVRTSASSMIRKLSVASIASNFTKRSGSLASLHKTVEDDFVKENQAPEIISPATDQKTSDAQALPDTDDLGKLRLSVIPDEKENVFKDSSETLAGLHIGAKGSPASSLNRLATLKNKTKWGSEGHKIITPPLRTSSGNSHNQNRTAFLPAAEDSAYEEKENVLQVKTMSIAPEPERSGKKAKGSSIVPGGLRNIFR